MALLPVLLFACSAFVLVSLQLAWRMHNIETPEPLRTSVISHSPDRRLVLSPDISSQAQNAVIRGELPEWRRDFRRDNYTCLGWTPAVDCAPDAAAKPFWQRFECNIEIQPGTPGFCEIKHLTTGEIHRLYTNCDGIRKPFKCNQALDYYEYAADANRYVYTHRPSVKAQNLRGWDTSRGIVMSLYPEALPSGYAAIRRLRAVGCTLPIEIWIIQEELTATHPVLYYLTSKFNAIVRYIEDKSARKFYVKPYCIYHSMFDQVLFLDADNFAARDPTYLFSHPAFEATGAMFWPDYWQPNNTIFGLMERSLLWNMLGIPYVDMFEQESGQLLIDRKKSSAQLEMLMYFSFRIPRLINDFDFIWGDKDLFRFAWMKTNKPFYMIQKPSGSAGLKHKDYDLFCGHSMVQHDPEGKILFLHRNTYKLTGELAAPFIWTHIQDFRGMTADENYIIRFAFGGQAFVGFKCFGNDTHYTDHFDMRPFSSYEELENIELSLNSWALEAVQLSGFVGR
ncbi:hypothetical protein LEN26_009747 [Aphanomyces euteiches]|nr:hypothetical protein LEN26_009747 [Aphanomyces euteiches]